MTKQQVEVIGAAAPAMVAGGEGADRCCGAGARRGRFVASEVAREAGIHTSQLFRWRQQLCERTPAPAALGSEQIPFPTAPLSAGADAVPKCIYRVR